MPMTTCQPSSSSRDMKVGRKRVIDHSYIQEQIISLSLFLQLCIEELVYGVEPFLEYVPL